MVNVNLDAWNKLPKEIRDKVQAIAREMENEMWNLAADMDAKARRTLAEHGMVVEEVSPEFRAELNKVGDQLRAEWVKKAGRDAQEILDAYYKATGRK
jgi:TRAP-type C4-dicarboxylate transport system substrate-binding protein